MNQLDIIISLPTSLSCSVLRDWLSLKSVAALDSAYCSYSKREFIAHLFESKEYFVREKVTFYEVCNVWDGLPKVGRKLRSVAFMDELSEAQGSMVAKHCSNLTHVDFYYQDCNQNCAPTMWIILKENSSIEQLYLPFGWYDQVISDAESLPRKRISLPKLRALAMRGNTFGHEQIIDALNTSNNFVRLDLFRSEMSASTIIQISHRCPKLISVGLVAAAICDNDLAQLTASCPHIIHLNIAGFEKTSSTVGLTDAGILAMVQNLKGLQSLDITDNPNLTDASLVHIYSHCANTLRTLFLDCETQSGEGHLYGSKAVSRLLERCTKLRKFSFWYRLHDDRLDNSGITLPATALSNLEVLVLCGNIACNRTFADISRYGANLIALGFCASNNSVYKQANWMGLLEGCPKIRELCVGEYLEEMAYMWTETSRFEQIFRVDLPAHLLGFDVLKI